MLHLTQNKSINILLKLFISFLLLWVLYQEIFAKEDIDQIWSVFLERWKTQPLTFLIVVFLLMPVNWIIENIKWRILLKQMKVPGFWRTQLGILAGVTFSIFTPNRVGEYGGRLLFVRAEHNWKAVIATLVGSYSQLLAILGFGILGFGWTMSSYFDLDPIVVKSVFFLCLALIGLLLFGYYNISLFIPLARRLPFAKRLRGLVRGVKILNQYDKRTLSSALLFASLRYLVYSLQYYLMLKYFGIEVSLLVGFAGIATLYLLQTSIPLPPLMGLIARGNLALFIWGNFSEDQLGILAATFILWIVNLIFPAIIGGLFIINVNIVRSLGIKEGLDKPTKNKK